MEGLLRAPPIIVEICKYLTIEDIFRLAQVSRYFYFEWLQDYASVYNLKRCLIERFRWPLFYSRSNDDILRTFRFMLNKLREEKDTATACIGGCGQNRSSLRWTISKDVHKYTICSNCFDTSRYLTIKEAVKKHNLLSGRKSFPKKRRMELNMLYRDSTVELYQFEKGFNRVRPETIEENVKNELYIKRQKKKLKK